MKFRISWKLTIKRVYKDGPITVDIPRIARPCFNNSLKRYSVQLWEFYTFQLINANYLMKNTVGVFNNHYWSIELSSQIYLVNELFKIPKNTFYHEYSRIPRLLAEPALPNKKFPMYNYGTPFFKMQRNQFCNQFRGDIKKKVGHLSNRCRIPDLDKAILQSSEIYRLYYSKTELNNYWIDMWTN